MRIIISLLIILSFLQVEAQNKKVEMLKDVSWDEVQKQARKTRKKYLLLDFGSPRCSPCLYIKNKVFTVDSVADFINSKFVAADYTQGAEKKRLSKIYNVYSEPVILITDLKGNLLHRMEGRCEAPEMMARLRQGLDPQNNLVALQKKYENGERSMQFLQLFLNTLHIAGLNQQKAEVLSQIFTADFDLELLKTTDYWPLFLKYNDSPASREAVYVFKNRETFYQLFGEKVVKNKIDIMFATRERMYTYGTVPPIESEEYRTILTLLQESDYEKSSEWLINLMPAQYKFKNWPAMVQAIQNAIDLNVVKGKAKSTYMIMMSRQICWYCNHLESVKVARTWLVEVIKKATEDKRPGLEEELKQIDEKINALTQKAI